MTTSTGSPLSLTIISLSPSIQILSTVHAVVWSRIIATPPCPLALLYLITLNSSLPKSLSYRYLVSHIPRILTFSLFISYLMFSSFPAFNTVLTFQFPTSYFNWSSSVALCKDFTWWWPKIPCRAGLPNTLLEAPLMLLSCVRPCHIYGITQDGLPRWFPIAFLMDFLARSTFSTWSCFT